MKKLLLTKQIEYYIGLIKDAPDAETAVDILDGVEFVFVSYVIDKKFGRGATAKALN